MCQTQEAAKAICEGLTGKQIPGTNKNFLVPTSTSQQKRWGELVHGKLMVLCLITNIQNFFLPLKFGPLGHQDMKIVIKKQDMSLRCHYFMLFKLFNSLLGSPRAGVLRKTKEIEPVHKQVYCDYTLVLLDGYQ